MGNVVGNQLPDDAPPVVVNDDDDFAKAFADFAVPDPVKPDDTLAQQQMTELERDTQADPAPTPASAAPDAKPDDLDAAAAAARQAQTDADPAPAPAPNQAPPLTVDDLAKVIKQAVQPAPAPQPVPQPREPEPEYTAEEAARVEQYQKDFPDVYAAEQLIRRSEYKAVVGYMFSQFAPIIKAQNEQIAALSNRNHMEEVRTQVQDYDDVRDKVIQWIDQQPDYLKPAYIAVAQRGNAQQVADLIDRYKRDTGYVAPAQPGQQSQQAAQTVAAAPAPSPAEAAKKKAAAALAPTNSKRSGVTTDAIDPSNFGEAFDKFASMI